MAQQGESLAELSSVLAHVSDGVYLVDTDRRISYWNKSAERITGFAAEEVCGRCCSENILTHVNAKGCGLCQSMCPLAFTIQDGQVREDVIYLHHKAGHRVPVKVSVMPVRDEQGKITGAVETFRECADYLALKSTIEQLKNWGTIDVETGLLSRRVLEGRLGERIQEMRRFGWTFAVLLIEVDLLEELRSSISEEEVAAALRMAGQTVQASLRAMDTLGRWNGNQFFAIVANVTMAEIISIAERVRALVESAYRMTSQGILHVTVSIGAVAAGADDSIESLLRNAEKSLYQSRSQGRNRVSIHGLEDLPLDED